jgi:hypothetical protein
MKRGRTVTKKCKCCKNEFEALLIKVRQGKGIFCNSKCYHKHRKNNAKDPKYLNRLYQKKHKYGLSETEYLSLFEAQENSCSICHESFDKVRACVDHCHESGKVRGLLCDNCNRGLGLFYDNKEFLLNAIVYLNNGV